MIIPTYDMMMTQSITYGHIQPKQTLATSAYNNPSTFKSSATSINKRFDLILVFINYLKQLKVIGQNNTIDHNHPT